MKKKKAFEQRGDMAVAAWAEQQQRELNLRARRLARTKVKVLFYLIVTCIHPHTHSCMSTCMCTRIHSL